ncbi:receptor-like cytoplasmic kinase 176 isoform X2 [Manihot esculenta]|uniref:Protein kinase domain-containing protein n=1 Tax=Manihot esculenta TaxID=3983 RepID=A0A2C9VGR3_MANES|nr:receptor-like cytoplasmic kinase 176 isoform X2 [Manihot esculenta]OAY43571.1 hypothetical protein MANES_08G080000v8 [Manihot esculenta]
MGLCCSNGIQASTPNIGDSNNISRDGKNLSCSSSKVSSASIPKTPRSVSEILQAVNLKNISFSELKAATRNFRPGALQESSSELVFKGWIDEHSLTATKPGSGIPIAVKSLNQGLESHIEWLAEINYLGQLQHPNLIKLIGYCFEGDHRLLVYEFMPRGSLDNHLFRRVSEPLSWNIRIKVALGAARGLAVLHSAEIKVIHRNFKSSNILLDSNHNAKLSDFGLARDGPTGDESHVSTRVMGTYGYAAPEYVATGHLSTKCDVYSFGVVLLELLSGQRVMDRNRPSGQQNLVDWAKPYLTNKRKVFRVFDVRLEGQYSLSRARKLANLVHQCLDAQPKFRPNMDEVVKALEQLQESNIEENNPITQGGNNGGQLACP